ncbi:MAG TPA: bifunctional phosphoribosylaminoimidazolecarboxamide formyltransferase/IMP cyclohydrolase [Solirubrobacteraceae bacterium]
MAAQTTPAAGIEHTVPGAVRVRRALLSVSEKAGIVDFARSLVELGVELVSTGGTARELASAGLPVRAIEDFTGFPEMMDGRVKTLHPRLYAGLLALRDEDQHLRAAAEHGIEPVDLVCVNLYPFERTIARADATPAEAIENIDIGGPTMIRAAAKNRTFAAVVVDPADYEPVLAELRASDGRLSLPTRERLAAAAFACTARYDTAIAGWFAAHAEQSPAAGATGVEPASPEGFPDRRTDIYVKQRELRYGENPHQRGAYYAQDGAPTHLLAGVRQLHGKELSFNNLLDLSSARELAEEFSEPACAIVKHNNPCGCALGESAQIAYERAFACDPQSAYGGVIALNRRIDRACAESLSGQFIEVLLAPGFDPDALEVLQEKKNVRLLELAGPAPASGADRDTGSAAAPPNSPLEAKPVLGGLLVQDRDAVTETREQMRVLSTAPPSERQWQDMLFAWRVCRHVRSNAIVIAAGDATIGIGAGQMSRVDAVRIAVEKAREFQPRLLAGSALASDAYFPFADGPQLAIDAGVGAIVQPAGSVRDELTVAAADAAGVAMVATGVRHFRH